LDVLPFAGLIPYHGLCLRIAFIRPGVKAMLRRVAPLFAGVLLAGLAAGQPVPTKDAPKSVEEKKADEKKTEAPVPPVGPQPVAPTKESAVPKAKDAKEAPAVDSFDQEKFDRELLKEADLANDGPALLKFFQARSVTDADRAHIQELIRRMGDEEFDAREQASDEVAKYGIAAVGLLRQAERENDAEVSHRCERVLARIEKVSTSALSAAAARMLAKHKPEGAAEVLLTYLPLADDDSIAEAVREALGAVAMPNGKPDPALLKALTEKDVLRRGAAAEAFGRGGDPSMRTRMRDFLRKEADPEVKLFVALALVSAAKDKEVMPDLIRLLGDLPVEKAWRAEELLCTVAGETGPNVPLGADVDSRKKARDAWLVWWEKNADKADLAKLDNAERMLGYNLVMEMDIRGIGGRIIEVGMDGKERWKINNLQFPSDAVVLPGNRVLVAEQNTNRVTERDMTGKELWGQFINQPVNVQRMPNGSTVAVGRNQILEWDASKKQVFSFNRPQYDIVAGRKLRGGDYVVLTQAGQIIRIDKDQKQVKAFSVGRVVYWAGIDVLPNKHVMVTLVNGIAEYDLESGQQIGKAIPFNQASSVQRLPNGNVLVTSMNRMVVAELDRDGKQVWNYKSTDGNNRAWRAIRR
jgi:hypothetical protein